MYDLQNIFRYEESRGLVSSGDNSSALIRREFVDKEGEKYVIHKYCKNAAGKIADYSHVGLIRSVITRDSKVLCFSPPKSVSWETAMDTVRNSTNIYIEEFVEGVMINVFYDHVAEKHVYATKSSVYGKATFFDDGNPSPSTFGELFVDTCAHVGLSLDENLDKDLCYSFVMRHPKYRIVCKTEEPSLTLVAVYRIDSDKMRVCDIITPRMQEVRVKVKSGGVITEEDVAAIIPNTRVRGVKGHFIGDHEINYESVYRYICSMTVGCGFGSLIQGITLSYHDSNGVYRRTKIRDPRHQQIKNLRGNSPKLEYHYYVLASENKIGEYLTYYPEHRAKFSEYREKLSGYIARLYQYYREIYILKTAIPCESCTGTGKLSNEVVCPDCKGRGEHKKGGKTLADVPFEYRVHLRKLHFYYTTVLFPTNARINHSIVRTYICGLNPAQILFVLNYPLRKGHDKGVNSESDRMDKCVQDT